MYVFVYIIYIYIYIYIYMMSYIIIVMQNVPKAGTRKITPIGKLVKIIMIMHGFVLNALMMHTT